MGTGTQRTGIAVIGGAIVIGWVGYDNTIVEVTGAGPNPLPPMPVPVSMWRPRERGGTKALFFGNPTGRIAGRSRAPLICYEQLIVWLVIQSMIDKPDVVVATDDGLVIQASWPFRRPAPKLGIAVRGASRDSI